MNTQISRFCKPAQVYFAIAVLGSIFALFKRVDILPVFSKLVFAFIWAFFLNFLCSKGYKSVSWALVLLPYIVMALGVLGFMQMSKSQKKRCNK